MLTGKMAGVYIEGMQGDDPKYLRCASTLKHFYGNNTEVGRGWKNSSIDPRNKYELYLEPFRRFADGIKKTIQWYLTHQKWWEDIISGEYQNYYQKMYENKKSSR